MIDIEAMSLAPNAAIVALGLAMLVGAWLGWHIRGLRERFRK